MLTTTCKEIILNCIIPYYTGNIIIYTSLLNNVLSSSHTKMALGCILIQFNISVL
jgi:hypothetical protein